MAVVKAKPEQAKKAVALATITNQKPVAATTQNKPTAAKKKSKPIGKKVVKAEKGGKTEKKVYDFLQTQFGTTLIGAQFVSKISYDWCRSSETNTKLRYDIIIRLADGTLIIIEVDGPQHYKRVKHFNRRNSLEEIQAIDRFKEGCAVNNGHSLIRLNQEDVWNEKTDWQTMLLDAISLCQNFDKNIVVKTY